MYVLCAPSPSLTHQFFTPRHLIRSFRFLLFSTERYLMGLDLVNFVDANVVVGASLWANGVGCIYYLA